MNLCGFDVGLNRPLFLIAGPCAIESREMAMESAGRLVEICARFNAPFIFKSSFDKANRSSADSPRGIGMEGGLKILADIKSEFGIAVTTDVHLPSQADEVAEVADILQIPAFLCRQTDLIFACAKTGRAINIKKGQFAAPNDMNEIVKKARGGGAEKILLCERGASFGYNNLVADMRSLVIMRECNCPVVFDATHSVQLPGALGNKSGGSRPLAAALMRAAVAVGIAGLFIEAHPNPQKASSDSAVQIPLSMMPEILESALEIDAVVKSQARGGWLEERLPS